VSEDKNQHHGIQTSSACFFESKRHSRSAPGILRRKSLTHAPFTYIKNVSSTQMNTFLPTLPKITTTLEKNMLAFQQKPVIVDNNETDKDNDSIFLTCAQLAAYMTATLNSTNQRILIMDCGSPLRHTERRIRDSLLLNVSDKISRKRLSTRGLKNFLDNNQLNRLDKNEIIILYDDSIRPSSLCSNSSMPIQLSPSMKSVYDEIKRYDTNKIIYILQSSFDEFYQHYPSLCYISTSTDEDLSSSSPLPLTTQSIDIESFRMSEVFPGLYLGNARDAEDLNLLKQHEIKTVINISTSIPCYFENEKVFEYHRLPCHDSPNQNILQYFETTFEYIHEKLLMNKNILVHCQGGVSRSPSFIIGYLMRYHSKTFDEAYTIVKDKRSIINPNFNFLGQLTQYQQMLTSA
jgi:dual specificity MAP kinase phosphatase